MTPAEFQTQCLQMLATAREQWSETAWEDLEATPLMDILDAMMELEYQVENEDFTIV